MLPLIRLLPGYFKSVFTYQSCITASAVISMLKFEEENVASKYFKDVLKQATEEGGGHNTKLLCLRLFCKWRAGLTVAH